MNIVRGTDPIDGRPIHMVVVGLEEAERMRAADRERDRLIRERWKNIFGLFGIRRMPETEIAA